MHHQTVLSRLDHPRFSDKGIDVWIKRDDLNHPTIQGNKWHKLKLNLQQARLEGKTTLVTFGGAYSNHIAAVAAAGKNLGFETHGYIRGEELRDTPNKWSLTLTEAARKGMLLHFISRSDYRLKQSPEFLSTLNTCHPNAYILPEGGTNELAILGFKEICKDLETQCPEWTHLYTAVGTGGTLAGFITNTQYQANRQLLGVSTLKDSNYLIEDISTWVEKASNHQTNAWKLLQDYHGNGYAKSSQDMEDTETWFEENFGILLDPIYTRKLIFAFLAELDKNHIPSGSKVILYHSGGLQGRKTKH
ncbi:1-aminocyclopropane-1-carboxylate deaminase/D-cysteine desulfhydrase [Hydrogenovibrio marinus]|uniref:Cysteine desulfhydrase n=1 Tax=Hydrogenovibrio marinus TaxID=28885 RepID=A0A066ZRR1_HYDMR|nr:pyridoxal-phosphate dependent enzyme [Hydrogenovibrio marinus]KDN94964.1 cysteine desulfhydrase [Hydrogenovibrio marinus]